MTEEKFITDSETVLKFIQYYCDHQHHNEEKKEETIRLVYDGKDLQRSVHYNLCTECKQTLFYSYIKLQTCPYEEKPKCRKCPKPCYGKYEWKKLAKIMKYSGMRLGLLKIRTMFKRSKKESA